MRSTLGLAVLSGALLLASCTTSGGAGSGPPGSTPPEASLAPASGQPVVSSPSSGTPGSGGPPPPASIVDPVVAEIARVAGVTVDQVTVVSAETVTFPDGSLGCPQSGMAYTQIPVDGYRIVATAGGTTYDYRGTGGTFQRCVGAQPGSS